MRVSPGLYAPESYLRADPVLVREMVNGCGSSKARFDFVPDTILGLSIIECCNIHDWMYRDGQTIEDKKSADRAFFNNCLRLIDAKGGWFRKWRRLRAMEYYVAVRVFGGPSFWQGKRDGPAMTVPSPLPQNLNDRDERQ